ncbi:ABC transporter ATP-binding protein [Rhodococcus triatomae]|uniref:ABC-2 type transport system ATP-binding protein n=1 Tax=Rhodococcus triatomae TaxID=300028 RepID=A0A1G8CEC4_9NOCA|nr:ABC transporter ATP-binding protein [Rhodococcus triatomae]QNG18671.1 ABC transporter ATP-binding protein [Rhodococcus triatomae]QNG21659.1 ABC transporter ATP-binding protein [Rhodococcus triatomae]SDH43841.1 ABC-2 type transport system ATP-binding protein [Rhodococcus triatomae]
MTEAAAISTRELTVRRGRRMVLDGLNLDVEAGAVTGLLGPSGSGKTTLIRAVVGTQIVRSGQVTVLGEPAGSPALRHRIGYVTQSPSIYADLTVTRNVRYFASLYGRSGAAADSAIEAVGLRSHRSRLAGNLSGGQSSRVSLACALVAEPEVLLLDEPTVGLDPVLRADLWDRFADLARNGTTLLVSSHVMEEADHCATLLLLREGRLLAHVTPTGLRRRTGRERLDEAFLQLIRETGPADDTEARGEDR